ncbi:putative transporter [Colletotrichum spaethianum]|uniref:Transporter n=1 Tax=Colletotrichum spaethianum TaxID=700344 RepID=A0AA37PED8_9PEZI|nr:putative transporter [Colletotrichum spaethianum]GKT50741.1 putative transporter [Colletotrichum spaethianum]
MSANMKSQDINVARATEPSQVVGTTAWGASHYNGHDIKSRQLLFLVLGVATPMTPTLFILPPLSTAIIVTANLYSITPSASNRVGLIVAFYCTQFYLAEGNLIYSLIPRNVAGQTKKSTTLAMNFIDWAAGNMTAPQIFQAGDAPRHHKGFTAHFCLYALFNSFLILLRFLLVRRNLEKRRAAAEDISQDGSKGVWLRVLRPAMNKLSPRIPLLI